MNEVTRVLSAIEQGDAQAAEQLLPLVYDELRKLAAQKLAQEKPGQTLQATALVHEAYLRLVDAESNRRWDGRGHFFSGASPLHTFPGVSMNNLDQMTIDDCFREYSHFRVKKATELLQPGARPFGHSRGFQGHASRNMRSRSHPQYKKSSDHGKPDDVRFRASTLNSFQGQRPSKTSSPSPDLTDPRGAGCVV